jgi:hypothetical protein
VYIQAVNTALIDLYWQIRAISRKIEAAEWGDGVVDRLAQFIERTEPGLRGFTRRNLFRMKQFYVAYRERTNCVAAGGTIALFSSPHYLGAEQTPAEQTPRRTRILMYGSLSVRGGARGN